MTEKEQLLDSAVKKYNADIEDARCNAIAYNTAAAWDEYHAARCKAGNEYRAAVESIESEYTEDKQ